MKKGGHKKQVIITSLALMLAIIGYVTSDYQLNKTRETVSDNVEAENNDLVKESMEEGENTEDLNPGETVLTGAKAEVADYAVEVKLNREQVRSKNKENLQAIIDDKSLTDQQKKSAVDEMVNITETSRKEADAEMLLAAKGFKDVVVSMGDSSCDVVLNMGKVTEAKRAQVEDIVKRKTGVSSDKIVITTLGNKDSD